MNDAPGGSILTTFWHCKSLIGVYDLFRTNSVPAKKSTGDFIDCLSATSVTEVNDQWIMESRGNGKSDPFSNWCYLLSNAELQYKRP
jgi:hypothetical protein